MNFNVPKTLLVLLLCLSFVGQTLASTIMSYHMNSMNVIKGQIASQNMPMMDHSQHHMVSDDADKSAPNNEECCDKSCHCMASGCSSIIAIIPTMIKHQLVDLSLKITNIIRLIPSKKPTSLYRPPILS